MLKYTDTQVTFREIPDEVTLCINISGCPIRCPDCHSKELWEDIGEELTEEKLYSLIEENKGITCVCFMGGIQDYAALDRLFLEVHKKHLKTALYSGENIIPWFIELDYIKIGPYIKERGGLDNPNTNQRFFKKVRHATFTNDGHCSFVLSGWEDITYKFWKNDNI